MRNLLAAILMLLFSAPAAFAQLGGTVVFQNGRDGYGENGHIGTEDVEWSSGVNFPVGSPPAIIARDALAITVDESTGGEITQVGMRFNDIFEGQGSNPTFDQIPLDAEIFFAEIRLLVTSPTASDAIVSFNRVLGPDQNRLPVPTPAVWEEADTWFSLGGGQDPGEGFDRPDPIQVGTSPILGPENEAFDATLNPLDPNTGEQYGILSADQTGLDFDGDDIATGNTSINITSDIRLWQESLNDPSPEDINFGWAINSTSTNGWDFLSSEYFTENPNDPMDMSQDIDFRPALFVAFGANGDLDGDLDIDATDYRLLRENLGNTSIFRGEPGDLDFDTDVDLDDFWLFKEAFETLNPGASFSDMVASVPEPSTLVTTVIAALGLMIAGRRYRSDV